MEQNQKKVKRVGSLTLAFMLIVFGILMILQIFLKFDLLRYILMIWPVLFIMLGIEILVYNTKKDAELKIDAGSILLMFIIIGFACLLGLCNFGINQVLYNDDVKSGVLSQNSSYSYELPCKEEVDISNISDKKIKIKVEEVDLGYDTDEEYAKVVLYSKYNENKSLLFDMIVNNWQSDNLVTSRNRDGNSKLVITDVPSFVDDLEIKVLVSSKDKVKISGNFEQQ